MSRKTNVDAPRISRNLLVDALPGAAEGSPRFECPACGRLAFIGWVNGVIRLTCARCGQRSKLRAHYSSRPGPSNNEVDEHFGI